MPKVVTVEKMRDMEKTADASGLSYELMMENAGKSVAEHAMRRVSAIDEQKVFVLAGPGNNGGDGLVAGFHLLQAGAQVVVYLLAPREEADPNYKRLKDLGVQIALASDDQRMRVLGTMADTCDIFLDSVFGTGVQLPLREPADTLLQKVKARFDTRRHGPYVVAVDCPSGLDCDTGEIADEAIPADLTVTLAAGKPGLFLPPGNRFVGEVVVGSIGMEEIDGLMEGIELELADHEEARKWIPDRPRDAHKGTFGTSLIIAGSVNYPGAARLAGEAAYRVGAGLVQMAVPSVVQELLTPNFPEAVWLLLPHDMGVIAENAVPVLEDALEQVEAFLIGPGFGREETTGKFLDRLLNPADKEGREPIGFGHSRKGGEGSQTGNQRKSLPPCVIDADALKLLSEIKNWHESLPPGSVLTPHPGEMSILTGLGVEEIQKNRINVAREWAEKWGQVVLLKGAFTIVADPGGLTMILPFATPSLATAGTGDVLAGAVVGLMAQGLTAYPAAVLSCYLHGLAGEIAAEFLGNDLSVTAGDVMDALSEAVTELLL